MNRILFVTSRNIVNTCGELRLIKNRAETLYNIYHISTDFVVLTSQKAEKCETIEAGGQTVCIQYSLKKIFSLFSAWNKFKNTVCDMLHTKQWDCVVVSGDLILPIIKKIKKIIPDVPVIADIHGAVEELIEFKVENRIKNVIRKLIYPIFVKNEKKYFPMCNGAFVVSEELKKYVAEKFGLTEHLFVIPCAVHKDILTINEINIKRAAAREKYHICKQDVLFIYSGGVSPWQCIDESVEIFKQLSEKDGRYKMLLLSGNRQTIEKYQSEKIIIDSLPASQVQDVLYAGDFGFMLRKNYVTNRVAYPNKFLEYVSAGLKIITTVNLTDIAYNVKEKEIGYVLRDTILDEDLVDYCKKNSENFGVDFDARTSLLDDTGFENRLKAFVEEI